LAYVDSYAPCLSHLSGVDSLGIETRSSATFRVQTRLVDRRALRVFEIADPSIEEETS